MSAEQGPRVPFAVHMGGGVTTLSGAASRTLFAVLGDYIQNVAGRNGRTALTRQTAYLEQVLGEASRAHQSLVEVRQRTANHPAAEDLPRSSHRDEWIEMKEVAAVLEVSEVHARRLAHRDTFGEVRKMGRCLVVRRAEVEAAADARRTG